MEKYESKAQKPLTSQFENRATREEAIEKFKRQNIMQTPLYPTGEYFSSIHWS